MTDLSGKLALVVGVANKRSISWAIAQALAKSGARLALTYPSARLEENVRELAATLDNPLILPCDVSNDDQIAARGRSLDKEFRLDVFVYGAAFAKPDDLPHRFRRRRARGFASRSTSARTRSSRSRVKCGPSCRSGAAAAC